MNASSTTPFEEYPYHAFPIACTAPERLAVVSLLHGGPRTRTAGARVLELGCANGANLLPMAFYRHDCSFVGVDGSARQIATATECRERLGLDNLEFLYADFEALPADLGGPFDFIVVHGVLSWVTDAARDAVLKACARQLAPAGLAYLNYNTRPGWTVRGMVRDFLLRHTAGAGDLQARSELSREIAARVIEPLASDEHPYTQLMANEFRLVTRNHPAYIAHEYLAPHNVAYWRSEFLALARDFGLEYVAEADFTASSHRIIGELRDRLSDQDLTGEAIEDSLDLLCYRQMHSPLVTLPGFDRRPASAAEFAALRMASQLEPAEGGDADTGDLRHPEGHTVEVRDEALRTALTRLGPLWPASLPLKELFGAVEDAREDLEYLVRCNLIELRCAEPLGRDTDPAPLHALERELRGHVTSPYHDMRQVGTDRHSVPQPP